MAKVKLIGYLSASWILLLSCVCPAPAESPGFGFDWRELPPLPTPLLGPFVGIHQDILLVAGGKVEMEAQVRVTDTVYALQSGAAEWEPVGKLPGPAWGGAFVSTESGLICIGAMNEGPLRSVSRLSWQNGRLDSEALPGLPEPVVFAGAASDGSKVYVVGGLGPDEQGRDSALVIDTQRPDRGWEALPPVPGGPRVHPRVAVLGGALYVIGGLSTAGNPLSDAYAYAPAGWTPLAHMPEDAALGPALAYGQAHVLIFGTSLAAYHTITDTWARFATPPARGAPFAALLVQGNPTVFAKGTNALQGWTGVPPPREGAFVSLDYAALILYFTVLVGMGFYFARREKDTEDFFLGGRRLPWWAVGLSIFGTSLSAITYLAIPAKAYATDWVFILSNLGILVVAPFVVWYYLPRFRESPITTAYEYLEIRFNFATRIYGSLVFLCFQIGRISIVLFLPAIALSAATGLNIYACILMMGVLTTVYTMMGGIEAVIWTDVLQSVVLVTGALAALTIVAIDVPGGLGAIVQSGWEAGKFHTFNWTWDATTTAVWVCIVGNAFAMAYPSTADQTVVQRYLSTSTEKAAAKAVWTNALLTIPISILFFGIGTALWVFYRKHPEMLDPRLKTDAILPLFVAEQFPAGLSGLLIAGVFAAAMSSLDSSLNSLATVLVNDYYRRLRPGITEAHGLRVARGLTLFFGVLGTGLAIVIARLNAPSLFDQWLQILGLVGGGLAGIMALGVFTQRANGRGAIAGALVSAAIVFWVSRHTAIHFFLHGAVGFVVSFLVGYGASLVFPSSSNDKPAEPV